MKKLFTAFFIAAVTAVTAVASDGFAYGVWFNSPIETKNTDIEGVGLGIPVIDCGDLDGASLALCANVTGETSGFEFALIGFNKAASLEGVQVALVNIHGGAFGDFGCQIGCYNQSSKRGVQIGLINNDRNNALCQVGLININKNGMFPVMILVNFADGLFD